MGPNAPMRASRLLWLLLVVFAALIAADTSELRQLSDLYASKEEAAATSIVALVEHSKGNSKGEGESCVHRLTEQQMRMAQGFGEFLQLKCLTRGAAEEGLMRAMGVTEDTTAVFVKEGAALGSPLSFSRTTVKEHNQLNAWLVEHMKVQLTIRNEKMEPLKVYWLHGDEKFTQDLDALGSVSVQSFPSHTFVVRSHDGALVKTFQVTGPMEVVIARETCRDGDADCAQADKHLEEMREKQDSIRRKQNELQPNRLPKFTVDGYKKTRMPNNLFQQLLGYWQRNQHLKVREAWRVDDIHTNHWQADLFMLNLPQTLKQAVFDTMKPALEEWANVPKLSPTACYGIREYGNGSVLVEHVDRVETHAISAILNIDQEVTEPWELTMLDHHGTLHKIVMEPGDVVYYESARCLHGRPTAFNGKSYANVFVHFRPTEGWTFKQEQY